MQPREKNFAVSFGNLRAPGLARRFPTNVGLLAVFTVFEAVLVAVVVSSYELTSVLRTREGPWSVYPSTHALHQFRIPTDLQMGEAASIRST